MVLSDSFDLILKTDGASRGNPGHSGIGGQILNGDGLLLLEFSEYIGEATNNVAEYAALIFGLERALSVGSGHLLINSDSELLVRQLNGQYRVKNSALKPLFVRVNSLLARFKTSKIEHIFRDDNFSADALANRAIDDFLAGERKLLEILDKSVQTSLFE